MVHNMIKTSSSPAAHSFDVRPPKDEPSGRTNDDIHTSIRFCAATKTIIDTPQMQRLRGLKQLGTAELVYVTATHNRFEHSLGVGHLAEQKLMRIMKRQPLLPTTEKDVLCVKIAGLLHDLGHGPFSHVYDGVFRTELKKKAEDNRHLYNDVSPEYLQKMDDDGWKHEDASLMMIDALLKSLGLEIDEDNLDKHLKQIGNGIDAKKFGIYGYKKEVGTFYDGEQDLPQDYLLTSRDWIFIKECIAGGPLPPKGMSIKAAKNAKLGHIVGRKNANQEYLYDIISNLHSGLDVDKMDYFSRDGCRTATGDSAFNDFLLENAYVAKGLCETPQDCWKCRGKQNQNEHLMICYQSPKTINTAMNFFRQRFNNYMNIYEHHKTKAASFMIADILTLADPYFRLSKSKLPISLACYDADAYLKLKDSIIDIIEENEHDLLKDAKDLIERYRRRKLYKTVAEQKISTSVSWTLNFWEMDSEMIKQELIDRSVMRDLSSDDIIVEKLQFHFGMKSENPVNHMRFLPKDQLKKATRCRAEDLPVAIKVDESEYECDTSKSYLHRSIRVFYKPELPHGEDYDLKDCFNQLVEGLQGEEQVYDASGSLSGDIENVDFSANMAANVNICTQSPVKNDDEDDEEESPVVYKKRKNNSGSFYNSAIGRFDQR